MTSDARPTAELPFKRIILDRSSPIPLYYQLAQQLEKAIEDGQVTPGTRMENELDLAAQLSLSRPTARMLFSNVATIGQHNGTPTLSVRLANQRRNLCCMPEAKLADQSHGLDIRGLIEVTAIDLRQFFGKSLR